MKTCIRCGSMKPLGDYYRHRMMADGHLNKCKACCRTQARQRHYAKMRDPAWVEAERRRGREKAPLYNLGAPAEMKAAHSAAARALPDVPQDVERHHWSYDEAHWADVILLTVGEHRAIHHQMTYDATTRCFRTPRGHLLDTRARHLRWIRNVLKVRARYAAAA
jgi:hypothetical protein